jgi:carbamoyl-phosphate synthase large subunit
MASTGEVACLGRDFYDAYLKSLLATGFKLPKNSILLSIGGDINKDIFLEEARVLGYKFKIYATDLTYKFLTRNNIRAHKVYKVYEEKNPSVIDCIRFHKVDMVINVSSNEDLGVKQLRKVLSDGYLIRRTTADFGIPLITNLEQAVLFTKAISNKNVDELEINSWEEYE